MLISLLKPTALFRVALVEPVKCWSVTVLCDNDELISATSASVSVSTRSQLTDVFASSQGWLSLVDDTDDCGDVGSGGVEPARLSDRANGLLAIGGIPPSLAGVVQVPAHDPGRANGDGMSAVVG